MKTIWNSSGIKKGNQNKNKQKTSNKWKKNTKMKYNKWEESIKMK